MAEADALDKISCLFRRKGGSQYGGEAVTQEEHALQAALLAEESGAPAELIAAALLHDVGHMLHDLPDDAPDAGIDDVHERLGYNFLRRWFGLQVAEPVRLHVDAKRYLCAIDSDYHDSLSQPSAQSLALQGGPMSSDEARVFEKLPYCQDCVRVRRWDDQAKVAGLSTPPLEHFLPYLRQSLTEPSRAEGIQ